MAKVQISADLPDGLIRALLQHVRDFDTAHHTEAHFAMWVSETNLTLAQIEEVFDSIRPPFAEKYVATRGQS